MRLYKEVCKAIGVEEDAQVAANFNTFINLLLPLPLNDKARFDEFINRLKHRVQNVTEWIHADLNVAAWMQEPAMPSPHYPRQTNIKFYYKDITDLDYIYELEHIAEEVHKIYQLVKIDGLHIDYKENAYKIPAEQRQKFVLLGKKNSAEVKQAQLTVCHTQVQGIFHTILNMLNIICLMDIEPDEFFTLLDQSLQNKLMPGGYSVDDHNSFDEFACVLLEKVKLNDFPTSPLTFEKLQSNKRSRVIADFHEYFSKNENKNKEVCKHGAIIVTTSLYHIADIWYNDYSLENLKVYAGLLHTAGIAIDKSEQALQHYLNYVLHLLLDKLGFSLDHLDSDDDTDPQQDTSPRQTILTTTTATTATAATVTLEQPNYEPLLTPVPIEMLNALSAFPTPTLEELAGMEIVTPTLMTDTTPPPLIYRPTTV